MSSTGLIVRRTERFEISLPARVRISARYQDAVQFAQGVGDEHRWVQVDVVDFAKGGIGFVADIFFARALDIEVEIPNFEDPSQDSMLRCEMQVKRVQMTDRRPAYLVGCAFVDLDDEKKSAIDEMIQRLIGMDEECESDGGDHA